MFAFSLLRQRSFAAFWHIRICHAFENTATITGASAVYLEMASPAASDNRVCQSALCSNLAFAGGLCRKHAALKLLSSPNTRTTPQKPSPMQLYRKTVDMPSTSRAHYDAVLHRIDSVLAPPHSNHEIASSRPSDAAARTELQCHQHVAGLSQMPLPLTRSAVAR